MDFQASKIKTMSLQINGANEKILKKIALKTKQPPFEILLNLLLKEHRVVFKQDYPL